MAQEADTVYLEGVTVTSIQEENYALQQSLTQLPADSIASSSLSELLLNRLPIHINQYGARGQLASINLRGLGPSRTSLVWNNMEINSFTTGQTDFNLISAGATGNISLQRGAASSIYGNGALGGTIALESPASFGRGTAIGAGQSIGSFGLLNTTLGLDHGGEKLSWGIRGNYLSVDNDFKYTFNGEQVRQNNASYESINVTPYLAWLISKTSTLKLDLWYNENDRQIQPGKGNFTNDDRLKDRNWRGVLNYFVDRESFSWENQVGYTRDHQVYNDQDPLVANRFFVSSQAEQALGKQWTTRLGANLNAIEVTSPSHEDGAREVRNDFFGSFIWVPTARLELKVNARQPMAKGQLKPFSPSFSAHWTAMKKQQVSLGVNSQVSRGFRLPTFNDRYWQPGGNIDLLSETSNNIEVGANVLWQPESWKLTAQVQGFRNDVENWIIWIPGGREVGSDGEVQSFWFPDNVRRVTATGAEFDFSLAWDVSPGHTIEARHSGSYTQAINKQAISRFDRSEGKQLPFTPEHLHLSTLTYQWRDFRVVANRSFTSLRYTEANNELPPLPAFTLHNLTIAKGWKIGAMQLNTQVSILNLTDEDYESFENRAMPGANFEFTLQAKYRLP